MFSSRQSFYPRTGHLCATRIMRRFEYSNNWFVQDGGTRTLIRTRVGRLTEVRASHITFTEYIVKYYRKFSRKQDGNGEISELTVCALVVRTATRWEHLLYMQATADVCGLCLRPIITEYF